MIIKEEFADIAMPTRGYRKDHIIPLACGGRRSVKPASISVLKARPSHVEAALLKRGERLGRSKAQLQSSRSFASAGKVRRITSFSSCTAPSGASAFHITVW